MSQFGPHLHAHRKITIRCGLELIYDAQAWTPGLLLLQPQSQPNQIIERGFLTTFPEVPLYEMRDLFGNRIHRVTLPPGRTTIRLDTLISVPSVPENYFLVDGEVPFEQLPPEVVRYTLPSRYCDSDSLIEFAFQQFGHIPPGVARVSAICDWVHNNIEYRFGAGSPRFMATDILRQRYGVCRDFAHLALTLCRAMNIPARYVSGFVPDVAFEDPGSPMDFHAYFQVYLAHRWQTFDARFNVPRTGRIDIVHGLDAVDTAFSTLYGSAALSSFFVWAYQVDPKIRQPRRSRRFIKAPRRHGPTSAERRRNSLRRVSLAKPEVENLQRFSAKGPLAGHSCSSSNT